MAREIIEEQCLPNALVRLVRDPHDDPERTDRWFVEISCQIRFDEEARARSLLAHFRTLLATGAL